MFEAELTFKNLNERFVSRMWVFYYALNDCGFHLAHFGTTAFQTGDACAFGMQIASFMVVQAHCRNR